MTLLDTYQHALATSNHHDDPAQRKAIAELQTLHERLVNQANQGNSPLSRLFARLTGQPPGNGRGVYIWGDTGRGKTWLMNMFYQNLPFDNKQRLHFHHFMLDVHERLTSKNRQKNPLQLVAQDLAGQYQVLCLDEFIVTNITDAMLLYGLLQALFSQGVILVMTSNRVPDDLYQNGLQRERFLPAIELIRQHTQILHLDGDTDHRLALLEQSNIYYTPLTNRSDDILEQRLQTLATEPIEYGKVLQVNKRPINSRACADEIAWFEFNALCDAPRAAQDYIVLAQDFHTIILSDVPQMDEFLDDKARRFIYLIDELYDKCVKLIISAAQEPDKLYTGEMLIFPFNRTSSRLIEMRTKDYLSRPHISQNDR